MSNDARLSFIHVSCERYTGEVKTVEVEEGFFNGLSKDQQFDVLARKTGWTKFAEIERFWIQKK